jgi:hypothetical protein
MIKKYLYSLVARQLGHGILVFERIANRAKTSIYSCTSLASWSRSISKSPAEKSGLMRAIRAMAIALPIILTVVLGLANAPKTKAAPPTLKDEIVGTWNLESRIIRRADGSESFDPRFGEHPVGYIAYDRTGHMSIQQMRPGRTKDDPTNGYEAYFGTYSVDEEKKVVTHHIEGDMLSDRVGQELRREFEIKSDELTLIVHDRPAENGKPITILMHYSRMKAK